MKALAEAQHYLLIQYDNLIHTVSEGLEYVEKQICDGGSFRTPVVFQDILDAFIQMNHTHEQIADIFNEEGMHLLLEEFSRMIIHLQAWFDEDTEEGKILLLRTRIIPSYEAWKLDVQRYLYPYVCH
ncbi:hypothetical protein QRD89_14460 [Halobacillus sp. ACCC02827]|uniref:hypothetical protein n=1 Tax=Halobacillus sp. ACCC02827 TaxID=3052090 RepID=UPI00257039AF|nr:hypothetical protein [Halobacillus sp. ACCC02827]WJE14911.1 hypothetical protein QRD89_14460 [Halobacillus sp. ACCC02827]